MRRQTGLSAPRLTLGFAVFACLLFFAAAPAQGATLTPLNTREQALLEAMNDIREKHGLRPLRLSTVLNKAAHRHAKSMAANGYSSHDLYTPSLADNWTPIGTWLRWYWPGPGYTSWSMGENIAWGAPDLTRSQAMQFWMNSPPHRSSILGSFNRVGIAAVHVTNPVGAFKDYDSATVWSVDFGRRSG